MTFRMLYAFNENFVLPLSHDEVVHGKGSLLGKMPGDDWQKFANLRLLYGYMFAQPAKKLLFMGGEFGQWAEWSHEASLDWHLLDYPLHHGMLRWLEDLNRLYRAEPALHELDLDPAGFAWVDANDTENSVFAFARRGRSTDQEILAIFNCTPVPRQNYRIGVRPGFWHEVLNSDAREYGGSGQGNLGGQEGIPIPSHGQLYSVTLTLPPLGAVYFRGPGAAP
jgi:1,4-alpha-glucan branching enzyme